MPAGLEQIEWRALLFDPGVVAEVEDAAPVGLGAVDHVVGADRPEVLTEHLGGVGGGELVAVAAGEQLGALARVERGAVGGDGDDRVVGAEVEELGGLDRGEHVADRREPEVLKRRHDVGGHALRPGEVLAPGVGVEEGVEFVGRLVGDRHHDVGVHHVVDDRDVLVADALDVVLAESVLEHRRAFEGFDGDDLRAVLLLQPVAGGDRAGRSGRRGERREVEVAALLRKLLTDRFEDVAQRTPGHPVVPEVVAELGELVEHEVARIEGELVAGVVDLLDVRLGAVGADDVLGGVGAPLVEPVEALLAHALGEDGDAAAGRDPADGDATAGVVPGRRPDGAVVGRVELAGDDPRRQARVGGEHLVGGDHREAVAEHDDDRALDAGEARRQHDVIGHVDPVAGEVVVPVDPPQVAGVGPLRVGVADLGVVVEGGGVLELGERRQGDGLRPEPLDAVGERRFIDDPIRQPELVLEGVRGGVDVSRCSHLDILSKGPAKCSIIAAGVRPLLQSRAPTWFPEPGSVGTSVMCSLHLPGAPRQGSEFRRTA